MVKARTSVTHSRRWVLAIGLAGLMSVSAPALSSALAAIELTTTEMSSIQSSLTAAIVSAHGDTAGIEAAIDQAMEDAVVGRCDATSSATIASLIVTSAESAGATDAEIGTGLAQASAALEKTCLAAASAIATTISNVGKADEILAYQSTITGLGYANLADLAGEGATPTGETGGSTGGFTTGGGFTGGAGGGGGGCLNPSCTKL